MTFRSLMPDVEIPDQSLPAFVLEHAAERGDKPALIDGPSGRTLTYAELAWMVGRTAAGLDAEGFRKGDVLAILAPNLPEWPVVYFGTQAAGGIVTGINPLYTVEEIAFQLHDSGARYLVTVPMFLDRAAAAAAKVGIDELFVLGEASGATPFSTLLGHGEEPPDVDIDPATDLASLPYSSGTTGLSKGVMLTHRSMVASTCQTEPLWAYTSQDTTIGVLPYFHSAGCFVQMVHALRGGATIVTMPRFDLELFLGLIEAHRVTKVIVVPPIVLALAQSPAVDHFDLSSLQWIAAGAAPLGAELEQACAERLGCPVFQGYGMTETSPMIAISPTDRDNPENRHRPGSVGMLVASTEVRIIDPTTGGKCGPDQVGELWIRGPQVMRGYLNQPGATAATIDPEEWMRTGDLGRIDADGWVFLVDRVKELIKYKAYQVAPAELEALLIAHPAVADAAVIPKPDVRAGEIPKAYIVPATEVTVEELMAYVAARVAPHKKVREVAFVDQIPKSPTGKILRRVLIERERAAM
ncbi:MAG: AMP-binding protein [Egibacteraceae bacterium]